MITQNQASGKETEITKRQRNTRELRMLLYTEAGRIYTRTFPDIDHIIYVGTIVWL